VREADHSPPSSAEVNAWSIPLLPDTPSWRGSPLKKAQGLEGIIFYRLVLFLSARSCTHAHTQGSEIGQSIYWLGYRLDYRSSIAGRGKEFFSSPPLQDRIWPPPPHPIQWVPGALSLCVQRSRRESDHSPVSSVEVKNTWSYAFTSTCLNSVVVIKGYAFMAWYLVKHKDDFTSLRARARAHTHTHTHAYFFLDLIQGKLGKFVVPTTWPGRSVQ
jgi:hypothetical protein